MRCVEARRCAVLKKEKYFACVLRDKLSSWGSENPGSGISRLKLNQEAFQFCLLAFRSFGFPQACSEHSPEIPSFLPAGDIQFESGLGECIKMFSLITP